MIRCDGPHGEPALLKPEEFQLLSMAMAQGAVIEMKIPSLDEEPPFPGDVEDAGMAYAVDQDELNATVDAIIREDSRSWLTWTYDAGSVENTAIAAASDDGRTQVIQGEYSYNGGQRGEMQVKVTAGEVDCIQFWNEPSCRPLGSPPSHKLAGAAMLGLMMGMANGGGQSSGEDGTCDLIKIGGQVQPDPIDPDC